MDFLIACAKIDVLVELAKRFRGKNQTDRCFNFCLETRVLGSRGTFTSLYYLWVS